MSSEVARPLQSSELAPGLEVRNLSKAFGRTMVLRSFEIQIARGEIHALVGENGSGKSSLIKVLSGYHAPESGAEVFVDGVPLRFESPAASYALGCRFVQQDLGLIDSLSVQDNLALTTGFSTRFATIRPRRQRQMAIRDLERVGLDIDPRSLLGHLTPAMKTGVAIARALHEDSQSTPKVLVLDEPTATLPQQEVEQLLDTLRHVASRGMSVLYVTHRLDEVFEISKNVTVIRDGERVVTRSRSSLTPSELVHLLVGSEIDAVRKLVSEPGVLVDAKMTPPILRVSNLQVGSVNGVSIEVRAGEIVGIAGVTGSGREAILGAVFGRTICPPGVVEIGGLGLRPFSPHQSVRAGMAYLPPDRKLSGGILEMSATENLTLANLAPFFRGMRLKKKSESREAAEWFARLAVRPVDAGDMRFGSFSGGNQQKILFGKWLRCTPKVFLLDEPTQGVDIAARAELHRQIVATAERGSAVVIATSDVEELEATCSRVIVLREGKTSAELIGDEITARNIAKVSLGQENFVAA